jgi:hypothetical protein
MKATKAKKEFKKRFGQANHLLITTLVGLDSIESGKVTEKPEGFSTSWNPINAVRSAERARIFTLQSFLGWAVESLEMYLTELNRKPKELLSIDLEAIFSSAGQSIYKKAIGIGDHTEIAPVLTALIEILITWRNNTLHYDIDNQIRATSRDVLSSNTEIIRESFCGLEISQLLGTWESKGDFTFKETASLISATHKFVDAIDQFAIDNLDVERYLGEALVIHFKNNQSSVSKMRSLPAGKKIKYLNTLTENLVGTTDFRAIEEVNLLEIAENSCNKSSKRDAVTGAPS